mmetsp:Transcript_27140/g.90207  ORF Transcript_27140/g.90207 Transcript_27140/m.90207 type:complete len:268 (-) Transcript_27140:9-812(-)
MDLLLTLPSRGRLQSPMLFSNPSLVPGEQLSDQSAGARLRPKAIQTAILYQHAAHQELAQIRHAHLQVHLGLALDSVQKLLHGDLGVDAQLGPLTLYPSPAIRCPRRRHTPSRDPPHGSRPLPCEAKPSSTPCQRGPRWSRNGRGRLCPRSSGRRGKFLPPFPLRQCCGSTPLRDGGGGLTTAMDLRCRSSCKRCLQHAPEVHEGLSQKKARSVAARSGSNYQLGCCQPSTPAIPAKKQRAHPNVSCPMPATWTSASGSTRAQCGMT